MKVLLTGATGFLGKNVARVLVARGHELRVLVRPTSDLRGLPPHVETATGDVTDGASLQRAAAGCGAVVHMAAMVKMWCAEKEEFDRVNVLGLQNALAAAEKAGARLLYTSSFIALGPTGAEPVDETRVHPRDRYQNEYERTKAAADAIAQAAAAAGRDIVCVYPGVIYGPGELTDANIVVKMALDHFAGRLPALVGPGDRLWSYAYVDDVATGHALALEQGRAGERYILGGENTTLTALFALLQELTGQAPPRHHLPYAVATTAGALLVLWAELTGRPPELTPGVVGVLREHWAVSSAKAERDLGYRSRPLRQGLQETLDWLRREGHV